MDCVQGEDNVQVVCRIRPLNPREKKSQSASNQSNPTEGGCETPLSSSTAGETQLGKRRRSSVSSSVNLHSGANRNDLTELKVDPDGQSVSLGKHKFTFDHTLGSETSQERIFQLVRLLVDTNAD